MHQTQHLSHSNAQSSSHTTNSNSAKYAQNIQINGKQKRSSLLKHSNEAGERSSHSKNNRSSYTNSQRPSNVGSAATRPKQSSKHVAASDQVVQSQHQHIFVNEFEILDSGVNNNGSLVGLPSSDHKISSTSQESKGNVSRLQLSKHLPQQAQNNKGQQDNLGSTTATILKLNQVNFAANQTQMVNSSQGGQLKSGSSIVAGGNDQIIQLQNQQKQLLQNQQQTGLASGSNQGINNNQESQFHCQSNFQQNQQYLRSSSNSNLHPSSSSHRNKHADQSKSSSQDPIQMKIHQQTNSNQTTQNSFQNAHFSQSFKQPKGASMNSHQNPLLLSNGSSKNKPIKAQALIYSQQQQTGKAQTIIENPGTLHNGQGQNEYVNLQSANQQSSGNGTPGTNQASSQKLQKSHDQKNHFNSYQSNNNQNSRFLPDITRRSVQKTSSNNQGSGSGSNGKKADGQQTGNSGGKIVVSKSQFTRDTTLSAQQNQGGKNISTYENNNLVKDSTFNATSSNCFQQESPFIRANKLDEHASNLFGMSPRASAKLKSNNELLSKNQQQVPFGHQQQVNDQANNIFRNSSNQFVEYENQSSKTHQNLASQNNKFSQYQQNQISLHTSKSPPQNSHYSIPINSPSKKQSTLLITQHQDNLASHGNNSITQQSTFQHKKRQILKTSNTNGAGNQTSQQSTTHTSFNNEGYHQTMTHGKKNTLQKRATQGIVSSNSTQGHNHKSGSYKQSHIGRTSEIASTDISSNMEKSSNMPFGKSGGQDSQNQKRNTSTHSQHQSKMQKMRHGTQNNIIQMSTHQQSASYHHEREKSESSSSKLIGVSSSFQNGSKHYSNSQNKNSKRAKDKSQNLQVSSLGSKQRNYYDNETTSSNQDRESSQQSNDDQVRQVKKRDIICQDVDATFGNNSKSCVVPSRNVLQSDSSQQQNQLSENQDSIEQGFGTAVRNYHQNQPNSFNPSAKSKMEQIKTTKFDYSKSKSNDVNDPFYGNNSQQTNQQMLSNSSSKLDINSQKDTSQKMQQRHSMLTPSQNKLKQQSQDKNTDKQRESFIELMRYNIEIDVQNGYQYRNNLEEQLIKENSPKSSKRSENDSNDEHQMYDNFGPKTDKVHKFKTRRLEFKRSADSQEKQIIIIHFEGVLGHICQGNLCQTNYSILLRHGVIEGLEELQKNFQIILYSFYNQKITKAITDLFKKHGIRFDAVYSKVQKFKQTKEFCSYEQIYIDFELCKESSISSIDDSRSRSGSRDSYRGDYQQNKNDQKKCLIDKNCIILAPINLSYQEIQQRKDQSMFWVNWFEESPSEGTRFMPYPTSTLTIYGMPEDMIPQCPILFLVPHVRMQAANYNVSFQNISSILYNTLITSWMDQNDLKKDLDKFKVTENSEHIEKIKKYFQSENMKEMELNLKLQEIEKKKRQRQINMAQMTNNQEQGTDTVLTEMNSSLSALTNAATSGIIDQPQENKMLGVVKKKLFMMTYTSISPKNHFKKILAQVKGKRLDHKTCDFVHAYHMINKYKLFSLKPVVHLFRQNIPIFLKSFLEKDTRLSKDDQTLQLQIMSKYTQHGVQAVNKLKDDQLKLHLIIFKLEGYLESIVKQQRLIQTSHNHQQNLSEFKQTLQNMIPNQDMAAQYVEVYTQNDYVKQAHETNKNQYYKNVRNYLPSQMFFEEYVQQMYGQTSSLSNQISLFNQDSTNDFHASSTNHAQNSGLVSSFQGLNLNHQQNQYLAQLEMQIKILKDRYRYMGQIGNSDYTYQQFVDKQISTFVQNKMPVYRFIILNGDQYQNYPAEYLGKLKIEQTPVQKNIIKWILDKSTTTSKNNKSLNQKNANNKLQYIRRGTTLKLPSQINQQQSLLLANNNQMQ